jgi:exopolyphosphatase / guanosine-5'-triphosphate,3'-diphosphate pyrophosphatase
MADRPAASPPRLVAVLDMGASAIRLVIAELGPRRAMRIVEEASRGVLLGRDTFSTGMIRSQTIDAAVAAVQGFKEIIDTYGVTEVCAVATSAVREARNAEMVLDRIRSRGGINFQTINEAEESRLMHLAVRHALGRHPAFKGAWALLAEVGGGSTDLTLLRHGEAKSSGVYALGAVRLRQQLDLKRHSHELRIALLKRYIANVIEEVRGEIPLRRVTNVIALGGDVRFAASQIKEHDQEEGAHDIPREDFLAFCDQIEKMDEDMLVERFRLSSVEAETLVPAMLIYRTILSETGARRVVITDASLRVGLVLDMGEPGGRLGAENFEDQVIASADALGQKYRFDSTHGHHVAKLSAGLFDQLRDEHGLGDRERLLLQVAALLHDIGSYIGLRAHHKHSQYLLSSSQIFGLTDSETAVVANIARYHRRGLPQESHLPYIALDRQDRLIVNKLAAILRVANALDAEHLAKVESTKLIRGADTWVLELQSTGDITMEQMAAQSRLDLFTETYGRQVLIRQAGIGA